MTVHYIFVTGGVISGLGKGTVVSSLGLVLQIAYNASVTAIKIDPYLNEDAGLMNPNEHGEVFVLNDGGEVDLDLGTYERALNCELGSGNNITSGKILRKLLDAERAGRYLGKTVQTVPHVTQTIQHWIQTQAEKDLPKGGICLIELGGTVGDYESVWFIEALRQMRARLGSKRVFTVHVALVPRLSATSEHKTKPLQHSVRDLRQYGWSPDAVICRADRRLPKRMCEKIALMCDVPESSVVSLQDVTNLYSVPSLLYPSLTRVILEHFQLPYKASAYAFREWHRNVAETYDAFEQVSNASLFLLIGKYEHSDAYLSIKKAFEHAMIAGNRAARLRYVDVSDQEDVATLLYSDALETTIAGCIFAGGFDTKGINDMIALLRRCRECNVPTLGICLGMQLMVIEAARHCVGWEDATSEEFTTDSAHPCIISMPEHNGKTRMGGSMRLGARTATFTTPTVPYESKLKHAYTKANRFVDAQKKCIVERHRHRFEVNPTLVPILEAKSPLRFVAADCHKDQVRYEIVEHATHPFYTGVQFHPEFTSRLNDPSPPILALVRAGFTYRDAQSSSSESTAGSDLARA